MKEHLMYDHNCNENSSNSSSSSKLSLESSDSEAKKSKSKAEIKTSASKQPKIQSRHSIATSSVQNTKEDPSKSKYNLRKRRRSTLSDENAEFKLDDDVSSLDNDINENEEYDADADENEKEKVSDKPKAEKKEKDVHIQQAEENKKDDDTKNKNKSEDVYDFESNESKLKKPQTPAPETKPPPKTRGRKPSLATQLKNSQPESPVITKKVEEIEPIPAVEEQTPSTAAAPAPARKPKALKQTNMKKQPKTGQTRRTYRNRSVSHDVDGEKNFDESPSSPSAIVSTSLVGNIRFNCMKSEFKCVECGDTNLKQHYRNDYTCHQCYYNTNCSKSFEFHLHGHLVKKRVALWNKVVKNSVEEYRCPCGFKLNAALDKSACGDTGNKFAAHLMNCEFKYCHFSTADSEF
jgi:hypothetical protein